MGKIFSNNSGYVALMSAIIISIMLLVVTISLSASGFYSRMNVLTSEYKEASMALAQGCIEHALLRLTADSNYKGPETVSIAEDDCRVESVKTSGTNKIIQASALVQDASTKLRVKVKTIDLSLVTYEEVLDF